MTKVYMDEEEVKFAGPTPRTLYDLLYFLTEHLKSAGRAICNVLVDGNSSAIDCKFNCKLADFKEVKIFSEKDLYLEFRESMSKYITNAHHTLSDLKSSLLVESYQKVLEYSKILVETIDCILQNLDAMKSAKQQSDSNDICDKFSLMYNDILKKWISCVERKDIGAMLDIVNHELLMLLRETDIVLV